MQLVSLKASPPEFRQELLVELGYSTDGIYVLDAEGNRVLDKYIEEPVRFDSMLILPGSTIILDDNPLSVAAYLEEYGDVL